MGLQKTWRPRPGLDPDPSLALTHLVLVLGPPSVLMLGWSLLDTISPYPKIVMDDCPYWGSFVCEYDLRATCSSSLMMKKKIHCAYCKLFIYCHCLLYLKYIARIFLDFEDTYKWISLVEFYDIWYKYILCRLLFIIGEVQCWRITAYDIGIFSNQRHKEL